MQSARVLVVGAGFAGAVHARTLAEAGVAVTVIDKRPHIAGNAFDEVGADGVRVHRYGPHLFHTANTEVLAWSRARGQWRTFDHRVRARLSDGQLVPMPINRDTINAVFGTAHRTAEDVDACLASVAVASAVVRNAAEQRYAQRAQGDAEFITFIGRCGTYRYLDMDQVVSQSLASARNWLNADRRRAA